MSAFDANLMFFTNTTITKTISSGALTIWGTPIEGIGVRIAAPQSQEAAGTIQGRIWVSDAGSTYRLASVSEAKAAYGGTEIHFPFGERLAKAKYAKLELVVTGTTAANMNFGQVKAGIVMQRRGIERGVNFS